MKKKAPIKISAGWEEFVGRGQPVEFEILAQAPLRIEDYDLQINFDRDKNGNVVLEVRGTGQHRPVVRALSTNSVVIVGEPIDNFDSGRN